MPPGPGACEASLRSQRGFTLVELLVALALTLIMAAAALTALGSAERHWHQDQTRADSLDSAREGLRRTTRELRQAVSATVVNPQRLEADIPSGSGSAVVRVVYACGAGTPSDTFRCLRSVVGTPGSSEIVSGLTSSAVFSATPPSTFVGIRLSRTAEGRKPVILEGGVRPRGCDQGLVGPCVSG